jgi:predicted permease
VPIEQAEGELASLVKQWAELNPGTHVPSPDRHNMFLVPLRDELIGDVRPALMLLLGAVGFVLLIACANVGNLLLAKAESRGKEIAVRSALGAGRWRLLRQFLTESIVLALIGGAVGLLLGYGGVKLLLASSPDSIPRAAEIRLDGAVVMFTLAVSVLTGLIFGFAPALHLSPRNVTLSLREGGHRTTAGSARMRLRRLLVVSEIALAVMLVVGAGLMIRSFAALQNVDPGFDPSNMLTFQMSLPAAKYQDAAAQTSFYQRAIDRLAALPGVKSVAAMSGLPPRRDVNANDMEIEGFVPTPDGPAQNVDYWQYVTADYFETMQIPIVSGRAFGVQDGGPDAPVAVINQTLARVFYPDQDPIGKRIRPGFGDPPWMTIIGVAKDVKQGGLEENTGTEIYFYYPQVAAVFGNAPRGMNFVMRTTNAPLTLAAAARRQMGELDASLPLANLQSMDEVLNASVAQPRFLTLLLTIFAAVALSLAAVGTYGVMAYNVAERRQEIGIRMALGAQGSGVLRMILSQGALVAGAGLTIGLAGAFAVTRLLSSMLYGVTTTDTIAFVAAPAVLAITAVVACWIPAWRATRVDPARVLRNE